MSRSAVADANAACVKLMHIIAQVGVASLVPAQHVTGINGTGATCHAAFAPANPQLPCSIELKDLLCFTA